MSGTWTMTKTKLTGKARVWKAYLLGTDEHGTWYYAPAGTPNLTLAGDVVGTLSSEGVQLVPPDTWWVAWWWADGSITLDVATPAEIGLASVSYVDLELDLWARDGECGLVDQDEYDSALSAGLITDEQDGHARATAADLGRQLAERVEPFGEVGWDWLKRVRRNELNVVAYDTSWPIRFAWAREQMLPLLPAGSRVEHFGSTAVPGLAAKDCIDIAVVVPDRHDFDAAIAGLESIGYEARREAFGGDPGHVFIRRVTEGRRSHHLHLYDAGHPNLREVLAFRDYLRTDLEARERYQSVKVALAESGPYDRGGYLAGKSECVQELLRLALAQSKIG